MTTIKIDVQVSVVTYAGLSTLLQYHIYIPIKYKGQV
jgi:hypothetical protein